ncbi:MAG: BON domain-containing protein, partial [Burkholderiales bacterium]|nr:BON domain-containing protein [Burkholderiales bacterium]
TSGTQLEDETIEFKVGSRIRDLATLGHVNVTSYNRLVLLTGEVPGDAERSAAEKAAARVENVRAVVNELAIAGNSSIGSRSNDTLITTKVKATLVDAKDLQANAFKVVTERGIVYLMGMVTEREATRAAELVRGIPGVQKVVRVFEILTEDQLANISHQSPAPIVEGASAPTR